MPIYEFYCADCHTVFNFLSRVVDTEKRPACPRCGREDLERRASAFAVSRGRPQGAAEEDGPDVDETRVERAMADLAHEADGIREDDPRAMARLMRKFCQGSGLAMGEGFEEAMRRLEAGEDPDRIEQEMGDVLEADDPFLAGGATGLRRRLRPPAVDHTLYEM